MQQQNKHFDFTEYGEGARAIELENFNLFYGEKQALFDITIQIPKHHITALIGPSGCGKSTLLRSINRMNELVAICRSEGRILLDGEDIQTPLTDVTALRRRIGMVFQRPNPFPMSIYENVVYGLRLQGMRDKRKLDIAVEEALRLTALWHEVKDRLKESAFALSVGQQQRLVIARAIAIEPEILLLDEPTSALDPIATLTIEELISELKQRYTVILVTHNMQQAARVSDFTAFMHQGCLIEFAKTDDLFTAPRMKRTEDYISGRYG